MKKGMISKILSFSSVDGPGNRTVIFLQGCNFSCQYCHNPETISLCKNCGICIGWCPTGAIWKKENKIYFDTEKCIQCDACIHHCPNLSNPRVIELTAKETMIAVKKNLPYIRGITVSGGECTMQREYLLDLLKEAKQEKLSTLLDSNGTYEFWNDEELLEVCDGVMLDIKAYEEKEHKIITGTDNTKVLKNLIFLAEQKKLYEVRTVVMKEIFSAAVTIEEVGRRLKPYLEGQQIRYKIIGYRSIGVREPYRSSLVSPSKEELERLRDIAKEYGFKEVILTK